MSIVESNGPPSWSLDASKTGDSAKCPWVGEMGLTACGCGTPPPPLPTGILYFPQFRSHQKTKMAPSDSTIVIYDLTEK